MRTRLAATTLAFALAGGGATGLFLTQTANATTTTAPTTAPAGPAAGDATDPTTPPGTDRNQRRTAKLNETLQALVDAGTITTAQRDAVVQAIIAAQPADGGRHGRGGEGGGSGRGAGPGRGAGLAEVAAAFGLDAAGLREALTGGKTIAALAAEKGIAVDTVIDAIVAAGTAHIDQAVTDGKLTAEQATTAKAALTEKATALVNGTRPTTGPKGAGDGRRGPRGSDAPTAPTTAAGSASA